MSILNATINRAITHPYTPGTEPHISLADNVRKEDEPDGLEDVADLDGASISALSKPSTTARAGRETLRETIARRKYAKYQQHRYEEENEPHPGLFARSLTATTASELHDIPKIKVDGKPKQGRIGRGQSKIKSLLGWKKRHGANDGESVIDILWENQRGSFLFGKPYYSAQSLLNFDPPAWTNQHNRPSAVDITNAQLPDPHWEWAWQTWYVDMSTDVDEQGWQYSFMFQNRFPWHGTHPWGYSWCRRRRWIRKRVRKHRHLADGRIAGNAVMKDAHRLNADYFTIHPKRSHSYDSSYPPSTSGPQGSTTNASASLDEGGQDNDSIDNIRILIQRLKRAATDREKINLVLRFMDEGGQQIHYLAGEMPHIMSIFLYQHSRRQLLSSMLSKVHGPHPAQSDVAPSSKNPQSPSTLSPPSSPPQSPSLRDRPRGLSFDSVHGEEETRRKALDDAAKAADAQIRSFEYWSDIRGMVHGGQSLGAPDTDAGWDESWQGLDRSGPGAGVGADALHEKGKGRARDEDE